METYLPVSGSRITHFKQYDQQNFIYKVDLAKAMFKGLGDLKYRDRLIASYYSSDADILGKQQCIVPGINKSICNDSSNRWSK